MLLYSKMDPLHEYHPHNVISEKHVTQQHLVVGLAQHALRNIPFHEHVLKEITPRMQYVSEFKAQPHTNSGKYQMVHI